jgi:uncharacterized membrane protein
MADPALPVTQGQCGGRPASFGRSGCASGIDLHDAISASPAGAALAADAGHAKLAHLLMACPPAASAGRRSRSMPAARQPVARPVCQICGRAKNRQELVPAAMVRPPLVERIRIAYPSWSQDGFICHDDLNRVRGEYVQTLMEDEKGDLSSLERSVIESLAKHETLALNVDAQFQKKLSLGERLADHIADFGGSWTFISLFGGFILIWIVINTIILLVRPFDPYPFILLNLMLSCLAAVQAPIIMMSQNRQESRDRLRSENDYRVNLKAELEIRQLHEKLDHLLQHQWERLVEIQQIQIELMNELTGGRHRER